MILLKHDFFIDHFIPQPSSTQRQYTVWLQTTLFKNIIIEMSTCYSCVLVAHTLLKSVHSVFIEIKRTVYK